MIVKNRDKAYKQTHTAVPTKTNTTYITYIIHAQIFQYSIRTLPMTAHTRVHSLTNTPARKEIQINVHTTTNALIFVSFSGAK